MAVPLRNLNGPSGDVCTRLHACTLADYTAGGVTAPAVGDVVTVSATGNWYVKRPGDGITEILGIVRKVELAPADSAVGYVVVEWLDVVRFVDVETDDATSCTLRNSAITDGADSVAHNFDAGATAGPLIVVSKSGVAAAAATLTCAVAVRA